MPTDPHELPEEWRDIPGWEGRYQASSLGRIRSLTLRNSYGGEVTRETPLLLRLYHGNYCIAHLCLFGKSASYSVHRLVAAAFHGLPPTPRHHAAHLNGDRHDNRPENLTWVSAQENERHKKQHGTVAMGTRQGASKLTDDQVRYIRAHHKKGMGVVFAKQFGVSESTISSVVRRQWWQHVQS